MAKPIDPATLHSLPSTPADDVTVEPIAECGTQKFCAYDRNRRPLCIRERAEQARADALHYLRRGYFPGVGEPRESVRPAGNVLSF